MSFSLVPVTKQNSCTIREDADYHNPIHDHDEHDNKDDGRDNADAYQVERKRNVDTAYSHDLCKMEGMKELD